DAAVDGRDSDEDGAREENAERAALRRGSGRVVRVPRLRFNEDRAAAVELRVLGDSRLDVRAAVDRRIRDRAVDADDGDARDERVRDDRVVGLRAERDVVGVLDIARDVDARVTFEVGDRYQHGDLDAAEPAARGLHVSRVAGRRLHQRIAAGSLEIET